MIKVLQIMSSTHINNGIANVIMNYYREIDKAQVSFDFLVFGKSEVNFDSEIEELGGKVYYFTKPGFKTYSIAKKELNTFFSEHSYDVIHCNEILIARMVYKIARRNNNPMCISHSHNSRLSGYGGFKELRNRILVWRLSSISDACFACSKQAAVSAYGKNILNNKKLFILTNAIDLEKYKFSLEKREILREELGIKDDFVLCNVGRLSRQKNQIFLVNLMKHLKTNGTNCKLLLVGDGEKRNELRDLVKKENLSENIIFVGLRKDVADILSASDLFVFPSIFEGLGLALVEAQANGLKCIANAELPEEVFVEDNVVGLSLSNTEQWMETIKALNEKGYNRKDIETKVYNSNFEIKKATAVLLKQYIKYTVLKC